MQIKENIQINKYRCSYNKLEEGIWNEHPVYLTFKVMRFVPAILWHIKFIALCTETWFCHTLPGQGRYCF